MAETFIYPKDDGGYSVKTGDQVTSFRTAETAAEMIGLLHEEIERLRAENQFLKSHLQMHSPQMNNQHSWRFSGGWPITSARGATADEAVAHAMRLVAESEGEREEALDAARAAIGDDTP